MALTPMEFLPISQLLNTTKDDTDPVDFIFVLSNGFDHIANSILSYLSPRDLCMCAAVSKSWRGVIVRNKHFVKEIVRYRKICQEAIISGRKWISRPESRTSSSRNQNVSHRTQTFNHEGLKLQTGSFRSSPQYSSPACKLNTTRVQCGQCRYFCQSCFRFHSDGHICPKVSLQECWK